MKRLIPCFDYRLVRCGWCLANAAPPLARLGILITRTSSWVKPVVVGTEGVDLAFEAPLCTRATIRMVVVKVVQELECLDQRLRGVSPLLAQGRVARGHQIS